MSDEDSSGCGCGCLSIFAELIGLLGLIFLWTHRAMIWGFVVGK